MYTDKPYDSATGLYYSVARFYDPSVGRFVTQDSYNGTRYDPLSQNRYVYARDNPMKMVDVNGHDSHDYTSGNPCIGGASQSAACLKVIEDITSIGFDILTLLIPGLVAFADGLTKTLLKIMTSSQFLEEAGSLYYAYVSGSSKAMLTAITSLAMDALHVWWFSIGFWGEFWAGLELGGSEIVIGLSGGTLQIAYDAGAAAYIGWDIMNLIVDWGEV